MCECICNKDNAVICQTALRFFGILEKIFILRKADCLFGTGIFKGIKGAVVKAALVFVGGYADFIFE